MKMIKTILLSIFIVCFLISCQKDIPKPETHKESMMIKEQAIEVSTYHLKVGTDPFLVRHLVKENDVFIECIIKGASFRNNSTKMILFIDGKQQQAINNAAFIVKDLSPGKHQLKLELYKENTKETAYMKEFEVVIPE